MSDTKYKKPYYGIKLDLAQVGVDIRLNDIPIYFDDQKGQLTVDLPAPASIIDGENELKIIAFTPYLDEANKEKMDVFLPGAVVTVELYVQEIDGPANKKEILSSLSIRFNDEHLVEISNPENTHNNSINLSTKEKAIATQIFNIESSFPRWAWQDGQTITDTKDNFDSLMIAYKEIHDALASKDKKNVFSLYDARASETAIAYHLSDTNEGHRKISTGQDMENNDLELYTFWEKDMVLDIYANGKLARVIGNTEPSIQPIIFLDRDSGNLHLHKFGFYKSTDGKWILIR